MFWKKKEKREEPTVTRWRFTKESLWWAWPYIYETSHKKQYSLSELDSQTLAEVCKDEKWWSIEESSRHSYWNGNSVMIIEQGSTVRFGGDIQIEVEKYENLEEHVEDILEWVERDANEPYESLRPESCRRIEYISDVWDNFGTYYTYETKLITEPKEERQ